MTVLAINNAAHVYRGGCGNGAEQFLSAKIDFVSKIVHCYIYFFVSCRDSPRGMIQFEDEGGINYIPFYWNSEHLQFGDQVTTTIVLAVQVKIIMCVCVCLLGGV